MYSGTKSTDMGLSLSVVRTCVTCVFDLSLEHVCPQHAGRTNKRNRCFHVCYVDTYDGRKVLLTIARSCRDEYPPRTPSLKKLRTLNTPTPLDLPHRSGALQDRSRPSLARTALTSCPPASHTTAATPEDRTAGRPPTAQRVRSSATTTVLSSPFRSACVVAGSSTQTADVIWHRTPLVSPTPLLLIYVVDVVREAHEIQRNPVHVSVGRVLQVGALVVQFCPPWSSYQSAPMSLSPNPARSVRKLRLNLLLRAILKSHPYTPPIYGASRRCRCCCYCCCCCRHRQQLRSGGAVPPVRRLRRRRGRRRRRHDSGGGSRARRGQCCGRHLKNIRPVLVLVLE